MSTNLTNGSQGSDLYRDVGRDHAAAPTDCGRVRSLLRSGHGPGGLPRRVMDGSVRLISPSVSATAWVRVLWPTDGLPSAATGNSPRRPAHESLTGGSELDSVPPTFSSLHELYRHDNSFVSLISLDVSSVS